MGAADVGEVRPLFVGGQPNANALRHQQDQRAVAEPQPILASDQLVLAIARERVFLEAVERRTVKGGHLSSPFHSTGILLVRTCSGIWFGPRASRPQRARGPRSPMSAWHCG